MAGIAPVLLLLLLQEETPPSGPTVSRLWLSQDPPDRDPSRRDLLAVRPPERDRVDVIKIGRVRFKVREIVSPTYKKLEQKQKQQTNKTTKQ